MTPSLSSLLEEDLSDASIRGLLKAGEVDLAQVFSKCLWDGRVLVRRNAIRTLWLAGKKTYPKVHLLDVASKDSDPGVREGVMLAFECIDCSEELAVGVLLRGLSDSQAAVSEVAFESLRKRLKNQPPEVAQCLIAGLGDSRPIVRASAGELLESGGAQTLPVVVAALGNTRGMVRAGARAVLREHGVAASDALVEGLETPGVRVRARALLLEFGHLSPEAQDRLESLGQGELAENDADLLQCVNDLRESLGAVPADEPASVGEVPEELAQVEVSQAGLEALAAELDVDLVFKALGDGRRVVRVNALRILALAKERLGSLQSLALERGFTALKDASKEVRCAAALTIADLGGIQSAPMLLHALADSEPSVANATFERLLQGGVAWAIGALEGLNAGHGAHCRRGVARLLRDNGTKVLAPLATTYQSLKHPRARELSLLIAAEWSEEAEAFDGLAIEALDDSETLVREAAAAFLGRRNGGGAEALRALKLAQQDSAPSVRREASRAVARLEGRPLDGAVELDPIPVDGFEDRVLSFAEAKAAATVGVVRLRQCLVDGRAVVRANGALAFGALTGAEDKESARESLRLVLKDGESSVRLAGVNALDSQDDLVQTGDLLLTASDDADDQVRAAALAALTREGTLSIARWLPRLADETLSGAALAAIAQCPELDVSGLLDALPSGASSVATRVALVAIEAAGCDLAGDDLEWILNIAEGTEAVIRAAALRCLGSVQAGSEEVLEVLVTASSDASDLVRKAASDALRRRESGLAASLPSIEVEGFEQRLLNTGELTAALADIPLARLRSALNDGRVYVRCNAVGLLGLKSVAGQKGKARQGAEEGYGPELLAALLVPRLKDDSPEVRLAAAKTLIRLGPGEALRSLVSLLSDSDPVVAQGVREELVAQGEVMARPLVLTLGVRAKSEDISRVGELIAALGESAGQTLRDMLGSLLHASQRVAVMEAWATLGEGMAGVAGAVCGRAFGESVAERRTVAKALGRLGVNSEEVREALGSLRRDKSLSVRRAAAIALASLEGRPFGERHAAPREPWPVEGFEGRMMTAAELAKGAFDLALLMDGLRDGRSLVRHNCLRALSVTPAQPELSQRLVPCVRDAADEVRLAAVEALGRHRGSTGLVALLDALGDAVPLVSARARAVLIEGAAKGDASGELDALLRCLGPRASGQSRDVVRDYAMTRPAEELCERLTMDYSGVAREVIVGALARLDGAVRSVVTPALIAVLVDRDPKVRAAAARGLGMGADEQGAVRRALREALGDSERSVRRAGAQALAQLQQQALGPGLESVSAEGFGERELSAKELSVVKGEALESLVQALKDGRWIVRRNACVAIGLRKKKAKEALPALLLSLKDSELTVRVAAAHAIGAVQGPIEHAVPELVAALRRAPRELEAVLLGTIGGFGEAAIPVVLRALDRRPEEVHDTVGRVVLGDPKGYVPALARVLEEGSTIPRENAVALLAALGPAARGAEAALLVALGTSDMLLRIKVLDALGRVAAPSEAILECLQEVLESDPRGSVQQAASDALRYVRSAMRRAAP